MAVSFRAASNPTNNSGATNVTLDKPSGTSEGDLMVAHIVLNVAAKRTWDTIPSGWAQVGSEDRQTGNYQTSLFYKVAGSSEGSTYQWVFSGAAAGGGGVIASFIGANLTTAINTSNGQQNGASTTCTVAGITPAANCMLAMFMYDVVAGSFSGQAIVTSNPTWTEQLDANGGGGAGTQMIATATRPEATATGNATASCTNGANGGHLIAIAPGTDVSYSQALFTMGMDEPMVPFQVQDVLGVGTAFQAPLQTDFMSGPAKNTGTWTPQSKT